MRFPFFVLYQGSKAGLERFSEGLNYELDPCGIKVTTVRAGQMMGEGKMPAWSPEIRVRFGQAALAAGLNMAELPKSQYSSVTNVFRSIIDLPPDLQTPVVTIHARAAD